MCSHVTNDVRTFYFVDIDDCPDVDCNNRGSCVDEVNDYHCKCDAGYEGKDCENGENTLIIWLI